MNIIYDLLPWEQTFLLASAGAGVIGLGSVWSLVRGKRVGPIRLILLALLAVLAAVPWLTVPFFGERLRRAQTTNIATTSEDARWLELRPRRYNASQDAIANAVTATADRLGWTVAQRDADTIALEVPIAGGMFTDEFRVLLSTDDDQTVVNVDSRARVGQGDLGENRRHVVQFFYVLDEQVGVRRTPFTLR